MPIHMMIGTKGFGMATGKKQMISFTIIPTPEFQISHYKEREYVPYVLEGCSDKQKAFGNWMQRDILFAEYVRSECEKNDIPCIINDGLISKDEMFEKVKKLFGL